MKRTLVLAVAAALALAPAALAETVTVQLSGVEARGGQILASLQTEADFLQPRGAYGVRIQAPSTAGAVTLVFKDVKPGTYALSVLHDADGNQDMKRDAKGMPLEGWAMINAAALRGPPTFAAVSFTVGNAPVTLSEKMIYYPAQ